MPSKQNLSAQLAKFHKVIKLSKSSKMIRLFQKGTNKYADFEGFLFETNKVSFNSDGDIIINHDDSILYDLNRIYNSNTCVCSPCSFLLPIECVSNVVPVSSGSGSSGGEFGLGLSLLDSIII